MEYLKKKIKDIIPYENNPRENDEAVEDVLQSIKQCSYIAPIVVDENNVILAGHTRYKALVRLGWKECAVCVVSDLTEEQKRKYRLYDNKTAEVAKWDNAKLMAEMTDVDFQGFDFGLPRIKSGTEAHEGVMVTCPCCGEVFEA